MDRGTMRTMLKRRLGNRTDLDDATLDIYLEEGLLDLATNRIEIRQLQFPGSSLVLLNGTSSTSYPTSLWSTVMAIRYLYNSTTGKKLERIKGGMNEYLERKGSSTTRGEPREFIEDGSLVYFLPVSDATYTISTHLYVYPIWTAGDTYSPSIEKGLHRGVLLAATILAARDIRDDALVAQASAEMADWLARRDTSVRRAMRTNMPHRGVQPGIHMTNRRLGV